MITTIVLHAEVLNNFVGCDGGKEFVPDISLYLSWSTLWKIWYRFNKLFQPDLTFFAGVL